MKSQIVSMIIFYYYKIKKDYKLVFFVYKLYISFKICKKKLSNCIEYIIKTIYFNKTLL
jgi:hypothetical protein